MLKVQETTEWSEATPNHIYYLDDSKTRMFGYVNAVTGAEQWFEGKRGFNAQYRTFKLIKKMADPSAGTETWKVDGSKNASYTVSLDGNQWSCTCPAFVYRRGECKHITAIKEQAKWMRQR